MVRSDQFTASTIPENGKWHFGATVCDKICWTEGHPAARWLALANNCAYISEMDESWYTPAIVA
jgi:hypothetical protein